MPFEVVVPDDQTSFDVALPKGATTFVVIFKGNLSTGYEWALVSQQLPSGFKLLNQLYKPDPPQNPPVIGSGGSFRFTIATSPSSFGKKTEIWFQNKRTSDPQPAKKVKVVVSWSA
ncbi:hypothetical protein HDU79_000413 [Rhizoclosmatium sp. JEL0117]|nr:hypothetical protein HDU79_000413 [Rhizoclosmatium sp. JEL0117]